MKIRNWMMSLFKPRGGICKRTATEGDKVPIIMTLPNEIVFSKKKLLKQLED